MCGSDRIKLSKEDSHMNNNISTVDFIGSDGIYIEKDNNTSINKKSGIVTGILLIALGLLTFFDPLALGLGLAYVITAGLGIMGISMIIAYVRAPEELRNGWGLINGVIFTLFSGVTLWSSFTGVTGTVTMISTLSMFAAILSVISGISQMVISSAVRKSGLKGSGWILASGIINILIGIFIMIQPVAGWFTISAVWGIYMFFIGLAVTAESLSGRRGCNAV